MPSKISQSSRIGGGIGKGTKKMIPQPTKQEKKIEENQEEQKFTGYIEQAEEPPTMNRTRTQRKAGF